MKTIKIFQIVAALISATAYASAFEDAKKPTAPGQSVAISTSVNMEKLAAIPLDTLTTKIRAAKDDNEKQQYVGAIYRFKPKTEKDVKLLMDMVTEDNGKGVARNAAMHAINGVGADDTQLEPAFIDMVQDKRAVARSIGMQMCGIFKSKKALPAILEKFRKQKLDATDEDSQVELEGMLISLGSYGKDALPDLRKIARENPDKRMRKRVGYVIGGIKDKEAIPQLIDIVKDKNEGVELRSKAVGAIGRLGAKESLSELLKIYKEEKDSVVQYDLIAAIGESRAETTIPLLREILIKDTDESNRAGAAHALAKIGGPRVIQILEDALAKEQGTTAKMGIAYSLKKMTGKNYDWKNANPK